MSDVKSITEVAQLSPDWMGFIFYTKSLRYIFRHRQEQDLISQLSEIAIPKVAVFVNEEIDTIIHIVKKFGFSYVQLHGNESISTCKELKDADIRIIKTFGIHSGFDWDSTEVYMPYCDFFLFDTHTPEYGGSGKQFDWYQLTEYVHKKHFLLSGGIDIKDIEKIVKLDHPMLYGIDINSKFEISPGLKDENKVFLAIQKIRNI